MEYEIFAAVIDNKIRCQVLVQDDFESYEYAYYLFHNQQRTQTIWYTKDAEIAFDIEKTGCYYVQVFVRETKTPDLPYIQTSCHLHYPSAYRPELPRFEKFLHRLSHIIHKSNESEALTVRMIGSCLECRWHGDDICKGSTKIFQLVENNHDISQYLDTDQNCFSFLLEREGAYHVECALLTDQGLKTFRSKVCNYITEASRQTRGIDLTPPSYVMSPKPFMDFCVIVGNESLSKKSIAQMSKHGMAVCRQQKVSRKMVTLFAPKDFKLSEDILLSGFIYERIFIYGHEHIGKLPVEFLDETKFTEMTGTFTAVKYQEDGIVVTTDLFGAGHLYSYEDKDNIVVSGRLHQTLLAMRSLDIHPEINKNYIAANLCYDEKLISIANFTTDLIFKGLQFLPLNQYIKISDKGVEYKTKSMVYKQMAYDESKYTQLLDHAKEDILAKVNAVAESGIFGRYIQEVTGGFDSRVSLAATLNCPKVVKEMRVRTIDVDATRDLECSLAQTNYYNLGYYDRSEDPVRIVPVTLEKVDAENRSLAMGLYRFVSVTPYPLSILDEINGVCFGGYFGETMRSHYYGSFMRVLSESDELNKVIDGVSRRMNDYPIVFDSTIRLAFAKTLTDQVSHLPGYTALEKFDNMFTFFYLRFHFGLGEYHQRCTPIFSDNVTNMIRISPFMSKYMLYASKMLTMQQRFDNKIMLEMAYLLKPEIIAFPYSSYGLEDDNIQLSSHEKNLLIGDTNQLEVTIDVNDEKYRAVEEKSKMHSQTRDEVLSQKTEGVEIDATRFIYLRLLKLVDILEQENQLYSISWQEVRNYIFANQKNNKKLQQLYTKLMGIYDQINIILEIFK